MIYYIDFFPPAYFCVTYLLLEPGNPNPLPVEAKQLTLIVRVEVELTLAWSSPCLSKDVKMGWLNATVHLGDHACVWVQFLIECTLHKRAGGQWGSHESEARLINIDAVCSGEFLYLKFRKEMTSLTVFNEIGELNHIFRLLMKVL